MLLNTEDKSLISEINNLFKTHEIDFYNDLPQYVKNGVEKSRIQANEGKIIPLADLINQLKNK